MARADLSAQLDHNLLHLCDDLGWSAQCRHAEIQVSHQVGRQVGIQAVKMHPHKELFNCPEALWVVQPFTLSF